MRANQFFVISGIFGMLLLSLAAAAKALPADCFGDNMVLQRELPVRIWGTADPGEKVTIRFAGQEVSADADEKGAWMVTLAPLRADKKPGTLEVSGRDSTVTLKNILVGEVWLCSGQSNMAQPIWGTNPRYRQKDGDKIAAGADYPLIRIASIARRAAAMPETQVELKWQEACGDVIKPFSAVGFLFGVELLKALDVPVGMIGSSWGGTRIEPWTPREGFHSVPEGSKLARFLDGRTGGTPEYRENARKLIDGQRAWLKRAEAAVQAGQVPEPPPKFPDVFAAPERQQPGALYNGMIHPLIPMTMRGAIWYQGENNRAQWFDYSWQMHALLNGWRKVFENPQFQFYFVQIAPYRYALSTPRLSTGIWMAQQKFADESGCGMAVINDHGDVNDIHPADKRPVGRRLAMLALKHTYGHAGVPADPPRVDSWKTEDGKFILSFKNVGRWTVSGTAPAGFEVAGIDGKFHAADVEISGARLAVSAPEVPDPKYVRYLWSNAAEGNLHNEHGLVMAPFRLSAVSAEEELKYLAGRDGLIYEYDLFGGRGGKLTVVRNNSGKFSGRELTYLNYLVVATDKQGRTGYLDIGMPAFTRDLALVGVPGTGKTRKNLHQTVKWLKLRTNVPRLLDGAEIANGRIEFFFTSYGKNNVDRVPGASNTAFDTGDQPIGAKPGYGCMQIHSLSENSPIFCFNNLKRGRTADLGFGKNPDGEPDWTFSKSARNYASARLYVFGQFK